MPELEKEVDYDIIDGVRYKRGSVKLYQADGKYVVETKKYLIFNLPWSKKRKVFDTLENAEITYGKIAAQLYKRS